MRICTLTLSSWIVASVAYGSGNVEINGLGRRQDISVSNLPTLGSGSTTVSISVVATSATQRENTDTATATSTPRPSDSASVSNGSQGTVDPTTGGTKSASPTTTPTSEPTPPGNSSTTNFPSREHNDLPLTPRITPALAVGGVVLILTGMLYALIGIKNRWLHIFLSTGYLTSLSICVLIIYVMNPPVSNAIQGAYFVGIFMTGIIFGAGALIFKEVTEGLGCLLGGYCLAMWFLTLKEGGLITSMTGKAVFVSIFCVLSWSLSFSHYTRAYSLMGSISFSGATVFVLGVDCFSRGGLKEFWLYIWNLNEDLFPLNTTTYPITKGTRVETVVIVLACIVGIISQLKLWKVISDRQKKRATEEKEETRRQEAVEAALGRHLERRNDRDKSEWERQYGNTLQAKRETILWSEAHGEKKRASRIAEVELGGSQNSSSSESLEMGAMPRQSRSVYVSRLRRTSSMPFDRIPEVDEPEPIDQRLDKDIEQGKSLARLQGSQSTDALTSDSRWRGISLSPSPKPSLVMSDEKRKSGHLSSGDYIEKKRGSWTSILSRSAKDSVPSPEANPSQEALVMPETLLAHSRASSLAATLDSENEQLGRDLDTGISQIDRPPEIVVSYTQSSRKLDLPRHAKAAHVDGHPEPPVLDEISDVDPEELVRSPVERENIANKHVSEDSFGKHRSERQSETASDGLFDAVPQSHAATSETSTSDVLTKGALERVPSQLSHVVMSYRTNEWAKHIASAEAPVYEEPDSHEKADEVPAHLAHPEDAKIQATITEPPPLNIPARSPTEFAPVEATLPSPTEGIKINPALQPARPVVTPQPTRLSAVPSSVAPLSRAPSHSEIGQRGLRRTSLSTSNQALTDAAIEERTTTDLRPYQSAAQNASTYSLNRMSSGSAVGLGTVARDAFANHNSQSQSNLAQYANQSQNSLAHYNNQLQNTLAYYGTHSQNNLAQVPMLNAHPNRSSTRLSLGYEPSPGMYGPPSQSSPQMGQQQHPLVNPLTNKSDTRLASYNSHQPPRRNSNLESQRREAAFADWRVSQHKGNPAHDQVEMHRAQMVYERQQAKQQEQVLKNERAKLELMVDARMRGRDMQELHREAMRKMQQGANKKI